MSDDPFGSLDPSGTGGPIEEPRFGFLSKLFRRRRKNPAQMPEGEMLDYDSGPPVGNQAPSTAIPTETPTPTPVPRPVQTPSPTPPSSTTPSSTTPSPTPPARLGTPGQTAPPQWPTPVKVSSSGGFPVGVIVIILIVVAVLGVGIVSCIAALDEGFGTADNLLDDFSNDFSNDFTSNVPIAPGADAGPAQDPDQFIPESGTDSGFDRLADDCFDGNMAACDELFRTTPIGDARSYEGYGATCGGRVTTEIPSQCEIRLGDEVD